MSGAAEEKDPRDQYLKKPSSEIAENLMGHFKTPETLQSYLDEQTGGYQALFKKEYDNREYTSQDENLAKRQAITDIQDACDRMQKMYSSYESYKKDKNLSEENEKEKQKNLPYIEEIQELRFRINQHIVAIANDIILTTKDTELEKRKNKINFLVYLDNNLNYFIDHWKVGAAVNSTDINTIRRNIEELAAADQPSDNSHPKYPQAFSAVGASETRKLYNDAVALFDKQVPDYSAPYEKKSPKINAKEIAAHFASITTLQAFLSSLSYTKGFKLYDCPDKTPDPVKEAIKKIQDVFREMKNMLFLEDPNKEPSSQPKNPDQLSAIEKLRFRINQHIIKIANDTINALTNFELEKRNQKIKFLSDLDNYLMNADAVHKEKSNNNDFKKKLADQRDNIYKMYQRQENTKFDTSKEHRGAFKKYPFATSEVRKLYDEAVALLEKDAPKDYSPPDRNEGFIYAKKRPAAITEEILDHFESVATLQKFLATGLYQYGFSRYNWDDKQKQHISGAICSIKKACGNMDRMLILQGNQQPRQSSSLSSIEQLRFKINKHIVEIANEITHAWTTLELKKRKEKIEKLAELDESLGKLISAEGKIDQGQIDSTKNLVTMLLKEKSKQSDRDESHEDSDPHLFKKASWHASNTQKLFVEAKKLLADLDKKPDSSAVVEMHHMSQGARSG